MLVIIFGIPDIFIRYFLNFFYGPPLVRAAGPEVSVAPRRIIILLLIKINPGPHRGRLVGPLVPSS